MAHGFLTLFSSFLEQIGPFVKELLESGLNEHNLQPHLENLHASHIEVSGLLSQLGALCTDEHVDVAKLLDSIFGTYLGVRYIQDEEKSQTQRFGVALDAFKKFKANRKRGVRQSVAPQAADGGSVPAAGPAASSSSSVLSAKSALELLTAHSDATVRASALLPPNVRGPVLLRMYKNVLTVLCKEYIEAALA